MYKITYLSIPNNKIFNYLNNTTFKTLCQAFHEIRLLKEQQDYYERIGYGRKRKDFKIEEIKNFP